MKASLAFYQGGRAGFSVIKFYKAVLTPPKSVLIFAALLIGRRLPDITGTTAAGLNRTEATAQSSVCLLPLIFANCVHFLCLTKCQKLCSTYFVLKKKWHGQGRTPRGPTSNGLPTVGATIMCKCVNRWEREKWNSLRILKSVRTRNAKVEGNSVS